MSFLLACAVVMAVALVVTTVLIYWRCHRRGRDQRQRARRSDAALAEIGQFLEQPDQLCLSAFEATGEHGERAVADALRQARQHVSGDAIHSVSESLEAIGEIERLERESRSRLRGRRLEAIAGLGECGGARAAKRLVELLQSPDRSTRRAAREAILQAGHEPAFADALDSFLADEQEPYGLRGGFHSLLAARNPALLAERLAANRLNSRHSKLALEALGEVEFAQVLPWARSQMSGADSEIRASASRFVGRLRDHTSTSSLLERLDDSEWFVRCVAARSLGFLALDGQALERLARSLDDQASWVRTNVAKSLLRQGSQGTELLRRHLGAVESGLDESAGDALAARRLRRAALESQPA